MAQYQKQNKFFKQLTSYPLIKENTSTNVDLSLFYHCPCDTRCEIFYDVEKATDNYNKRFNNNNQNVETSTEYSKETKSDIQSFDESLTLQCINSSDEEIVNHKLDYTETINQTKNDLSSITDTESEEIVNILQSSSGSSFLSLEEEIFCSPTNSFDCIDQRDLPDFYLRVVRSKINISKPLSSTHSPILLHESIPPQYPCHLLLANSETQTLTEKKQHKSRRNANGVNRKNKNNKVLNNLHKSRESDNLKKMYEKPNKSKMKQFKNDLHKNKIDNPTTPNVYNIKKQIYDLKFTYTNRMSPKASQDTTRNNTECIKDFLNACIKNNPLQKHKHPKVLKEKVNNINLKLSALDYGFSSRKETKINKNSGSQKTRNGSEKNKKFTRRPFSDGMLGTKLESARERSINYFNNIKIKQPKLSLKQKSFRSLNKSLGMENKTAKKINEDLEGISPTAALTLMLLAAASDVIKT